MWAVPPGSFMLAKTTRNSTVHHDNQAQSRRYPEILFDKPRDTKQRAKI
jgi:hypothetical protein